jgi:hypothetical protein
MNPFPIGARVRLNAAGIVRLGSTRKRNPNVEGTIKNYVEILAEQRAQVEWDKPVYVETLRPIYLEEAQP